MESSKIYANGMSISPQTINEEFMDNNEIRDIDSTQPKRFRRSYSCKNCRHRKIKCDRVFPCKPCTNRGISSTCGIDIVYDKYHSNDDQEARPEIRKIVTAPANLEPSSMQYSRSNDTLPAAKCTCAIHSFSEKSSDISQGRRSSFAFDRARSNRLWQYKPYSAQSEASYSPQLSTGCSRRQSQPSLGIVCRACSRTQDTIDVVFEQMRILDRKVNSILEGLSHVLPQNVASQNIGSQQHLQLKYNLPHFNVEDLNIDQTIQQWLELEISPQSKVSKQPDFAPLSSRNSTFGPQAAGLSYNSY